MLDFVRKTWPALLLALALVLILDGTISTLLTCHPPDDSKGSHNNQENCTVFRGPLISLISISGDFFEKHDKGIVAAFTVILAISTILLWWSTRQLWETTVISTNRQEAETKILQRAYISVKPLGINYYTSKDGSIDKEVVGHVNIVNVGRLPAQTWIDPEQPHIKWFSDDKVGKNSLPSGNGIPIGIKDPVGVLGPGGEMTVGTGAHPNKCRDGYLYVWGRVDYLDGFGHGCFTTFCHRYPCIMFEEGKRGSRSIDVKHARYHQHSNETEESTPKA
jgi:hypothetical protein